MRRDEAIAAFEATYDAHPSASVPPPPPPPPSLLLPLPMSLLYMGPTHHSPRRIAQPPSVLITPVPPWSLGAQEALFRLLFLQHLQAPRTDRTRLVPSPVLIGHAASHLRRLFSACSFSSTLRATSRSAPRCSPLCVSV